MTLPLDSDFIPSKKPYQVSSSEVVPNFFYVTYFFVTVLHRKFFFNNHQLMTILMSSLSPIRSWLELPIVDTRSSELTFPASPGGCLHVNAVKFDLTLSWLLFLHKLRGQQDLYNVHKRTFVHPCY